jgi:cytochrome c oxidase subunit 1
VLFGGSLFGIFGGITYWFPKMYGRMFNPVLGKIHFWLTLVFFNAVFFPMHNLGLRGHQRRIYAPDNFAWLQPLQGLNTFISVSAFLLIGSQLIFAVAFFWSMYAGEKAEQNPWKSNTLEWALAPTPPGHGNFVDGTPRVFRGPYEYSSPESSDDYLPQHLPPDRVHQPIVPVEKSPLVHGD